MAARDAPTLDADRPDFLQLGEDAAHGPLGEPAAARDNLYLSREGRLAKLVTADLAERVVDAQDA